MLGPISTNNDFSILRPVGDIFPKGLHDAEKRWLSKALELDFPGREIIVSQISSSTIRRSVDTESVELFFEVDEKVAPLLQDYHFLLSIEQNREDAAWISGNLNMYNGKVDSFYIYTADGSDLDLPDVHLDDAEYDLMPYRRIAIKEARRLLLEDEDMESAGQERVFLSIAKANQGAIEALESVSDLKGFALGEGIGGLCVSLKTELGRIGADNYEAVAQCSLVGNFFISYVVRNGMDSPFPGTGGKTLFCRRYPNGYRMGQLRKALYEIGYMPLEIIALKKRVIEGTEARGSDQDYRIEDCFFV